MSATLPLVDAPFVDTRAADLTLRIGEGRLPHLGSTRVTLGPLTVELAVIGCSHQALIERDGQAVFSETFACPTQASPAGEARWDGRTLRTDGAWGHHEFRAACLRPADFDAEVARITAQASAAPHHVLRGFAGEPGALTALALEESGVAWQTWHCYPQHNEIVHSRSRFTEAGS